GPHLLLDRMRELARIGAGAHREIRQTHWVDVRLGGGEVNLRRDLRGLAVPPDVVDDPDDGHPGSLLGAPAQSAPDSIAAGQKLAHEGLVHNRDVRLTGAVGRYQK